MCVRCQLDVAVRLTYCAHRFASCRLLSWGRSGRFTFGFSAFHGPHFRLKEDAIHTEHEVVFTASRYKSACKGTTFCESGNDFFVFFDGLRRIHYLCGQILLFMYRKYPLTIAFLLFVLMAVNAQTYQRVTNLPHVYIETVNNVPITSKTTYVDATMYYVDEEDVVTQYEGMQIRGRGNSTWGLKKKPYRIKFQEKEKFLGKGYAKAKKWTLLANAGDKTLMRNAVTFLMGDFLGLKNNPAHKFVDVTLNGTFLGNYQISDHVDVRPHRVNITEQDLPLTEESDITGGYLLEVDGFYDGNCFTTSQYGVPVRIHYPDEEDITWEQNSYIRQYMKDFETVLHGSKFADAEEGYRRWVDSTSLVNWYIATEVSGNVDGYFSTYFYKDQQDSLLYWGPLWDYDIAYNNDSRTDRGGTNDTENQLMSDYGYGAGKNWINRMWQDPWFARLVNRRYEEVLDAGLEDYLYHQIDSISDLLQESQELNYNKWGISTRMLRERVLYSSYDQYVADLKSYIGTHIPYLQKTFADKKPEEPTPPFTPKNFYYRITNTTNGRVFDTVDKDGLTGDLVCMWEQQDDFPSQQWQIIPVGDYFMLINRLSGMALNDPTEGAVSATTNVGTQLNTVIANADDDRQLWSIEPQGTKGYYNLVNKYTNHTANQSGGGTSDGTAVVSYTTDSRNATSSNRLWILVKADEIEEPDTPDEPDDPDNPDEPDTPDTPDEPDTPDTPDEPDTPDTPDEPDTPDTPDEPDTPDTPDEPDTPDTPDEPDTPDTPDEPDTPDTPDEPDTPDTPDEPDTPDTPDEPDTPDTPDEPDTPDTPDEPIDDAIASVEPAEYALAYNPITKVLHFGSESPEQLTFMVNIYASNGMLVRSFRASDPCSVADFTKGVYIIVWRVEGRTRSTKMLLQ